MPGPKPTLFGTLVLQTALHPIAFRHAVGPANLGEGSPKVLDRPFLNPDIRVRASSRQLRLHRGEQGRPRAS